MTLRRNVAANYLGQGWTALMGLAFIPVYIRYLGIEAWGLVGFMAIMQAWLALLDMGLAPTLGREMARFYAGYTVRNLYAICYGRWKLSMALLPLLWLRLFLSQPPGLLHIG
jgi:O-antigen/teichoic acid export membrane protein